jgi:hypothetical protein
MHDRRRFHGMRTPVSVKLRTAFVVRTYIQNRKEVRIMRYETPELMASMPAISAIQSTINKKVGDVGDTKDNEGKAAYEDWE